jgi:hypothetical protein
MVFPDLSATALAMLDMSSVLPITRQPATGGTVERGLRVASYGPPEPLRGPYVLDDTPGRSRRREAIGGQVVGSASLYLTGLSTELVETALADGDILTIRGAQWRVIRFGQWSELANVSVAHLERHEAP